MVAPISITCDHSMHFPTRQTNCAGLPTLCSWRTTTSYWGAATEGAVKQLSKAGRLKDYHVLHFATHGALAGEIENTTEPRLILSRPHSKAEDDDGYLSASKVT